MPTRPPRRGPVIAAAVVVAVALTGCAGEDGDRGSGQHLGSAKIVLGGKVISWAPAYVAVCEGLFQRHGLDVELSVSPQGTTSAIAGLVSGEVLSAMTGAPASVSPIREGAPIRMLFNAGTGYGLQVIASNKLLRDNNIGPDTPLEQRVRAMRGQTIGILNPGDSIDQLLRYVLPRYGMDPDKDITMTALRNYGNMFAAMRIDKIGALAGSPPNGHQAKSQGLGRVLFDGNEFPALTDYPYLVGSANTRELSDHPERVKALVAGMADALRLLRENPAAGKPCLRKEFPELDQAAFDDAYVATVRSVPKSPLITPGIFKSLSDFAEATGNPLGVDYREAVAADLVREVIGG